MSDNSLLGPWVRRFLLEHLVGERNLAHNTQRSYRDTLCLLLPFVARQLHKQVDQLTVIAVTAALVRHFLTDLEETRGCSVSTRNQRLAAIHALARFVGLHSPEHVEWCGQICAIPFKKSAPAMVAYLERAEMDALLGAPDRRTAQGRRDYALLLFLYNTGARADEVAQLKIGDLELANAAARDLSAVRICGKGNKLRRCPLWTKTVNELAYLISGRATSEHLFLNRRGDPITRFGIHTMVERYAQRASAAMPSMTTKRVSPHTIRHSTATHLLRAGVDINTIRAWLGHVSLSTTNIYAEIDLEIKARALATCEVVNIKPVKSWHQNEKLMEFLRSL